MTHPNEQQARALRDEIYGPTTEAGWAGCRDNWCKPEAVEWLRQTVAIVRKLRQRKGSVI